MTYRLILPVFSIFDDIADRPLIIDLATISGDDQDVKCCVTFETEDDAKVFARRMEKASIVKHATVGSLLSLIEIVGGVTDAKHIGVRTKLRKVSTGNELSCEVMTVAEFVDIVQKLKANLGTAGSN